MKKTKNLMLAIMLLIVGVGGASASKLYADLSKLSNGPISTWDGTTSTMTWTGTSNNMISNFNFPAGNYRAYSTISITVSDLTNAVGVRLQIKANGQEKLVALNGNGSFTKNLIDDFGFTASDITKVEWVRVLGSAWQNGESNTIDADHPASAVISDVYLTEPTRTLNVNLSKMAASEGNATWNFSTKKFAWTLNYSNAITLPGLSGNLSSFTKINYETAAGDSEQFRILIYYNNGAAQTTYVAGVGNKSVTFESMGVSTENLAHVSAIKFSGASTPSGNVTLNSFSLEGPLVNYIEETTIKEMPEGAIDVNDIVYGTNQNGTNQKWNIAYPQIVASETLFGGDIDSDNQSLNINDYGYLHFVVTDASNDAHTGLRVFVYDGSERKCLYPRPIGEVKSDTKWEEQSWITTTGTYVVNISGYPLLRGFKALQGWAGNAGTITVSQVYLTSGSSPVAPVETTVLAGTEALNDANATCFDVTGLSGTGLSYNTANPNAIFTAKAGQLTNTKNVIVNGTCANLELTDGYAFNTNGNFTVTSATYTTTINASAEVGTLCLPFEATIPSGVEAFTLAYTSGNAATATEVETSIPANTPVLLNGSGSSTFTGTNAHITANATNTFGALTGVFEDTTVPTGSFVLQNGTAGVGFYKVNTADIIAKPFRAYLTAQSDNSRLSIIYADESTGISNVEAQTTNAEAVYTLNGIRVNQPQKGIYVKNGKKFIVK